jgi:hypothetical protein
MLPLLAALASQSVSGQSSTPEPLRKSDLVRMLTAGGMSKAEIAGIVARNCLSFTPTERDRQDLRSLGADDQILRSIGDCGRRNEPPRADVRRVDVTPRRVAVVVGSEAVLVVTVRRGTAPAAGAPVLLGGGTTAGWQDQRAVTGVDGRVTFRFGVGTVAGSQRLSVSVENAGEVPVSVDVAPAEPSSANVRPARVEVRPGIAPVEPITVVVYDRFGNTVPGRAVTLRPVAVAPGVASLAATTGSRGDATFALPAMPSSALGRPLVLGVAVGDRLLDGGRVEIVSRAVVSSERSGFVAGTGQAAVVGNPLAEPLVLEVRDTAGAPVAGQVVALRAENATLPGGESAVTDSTGRARIRVVVGPRRAPVLVAARIGAVEKQARFEPRAGAATRLVVRCGGNALERRIDLAPDTVFTLDVTALDGFGNPVAVTRVRAAVGDQRVLRVRASTADSAGARVVLEPRRPGATAFAVMASGLRENFTITVLAGRAAGAACG